MKWPFVLFATAIAVTLIHNITYGSLLDCERATCRVNMPSAKPDYWNKGTGTLFEVSNGYAYVITCSHIMDASRDVKCEFLTMGTTAYGYVLQFDRSIDVAVVALPLSGFKGVTPKPIPIAPRGYVTPPGTEVVSIGCPGGGPLMAFKCRTIGNDQNGLNIEAVPAHGRSGSALFDLAGTKIIGMIRAQTGPPGSLYPTQGVAVPVSCLYAAFTPMRNTAVWKEAGDLDSEVQCGPECKPSLPTQKYALPYRNQLEQRMGQNRNPQYDIPLPSQQPTPATAAVDLSPLVQGQQEQKDRLDTIIGLLNDKAEQDAKPLLLKGRLGAKLDELEAEGGIKGKIAQKIEDRLMDGLDFNRIFFIFVLIVLTIAFFVVIGKWKKGKPGYFEEHQPDSLLGKIGADLHKKFDEHKAVQDARFDKIDKVVDTAAISTATAVGGAPAGAAMSALVAKIDALQDKLFGIARDMPAPSQQATTPTPTVNVNTHPTPVQ